MPELNAEQETQPQATTEKKAPAYDSNILPDMLPVYYRRLFPHEPFYRWLNYGHCKICSLSKCYLNL